MDEGVYFGDDEQKRAIIRDGLSVLNAYERKHVTESKSFELFIQDTTYATYAATSEAFRALVHITLGWTYYPDGDFMLKLSIRDIVAVCNALHLGWSTERKGKHKGRVRIGYAFSYKKVCRGVYQCPVTDCEATERVVVQSKALHRKGGRSCLLHGELLYFPCDCTIQYDCDGHILTMVHSGVHQHKKPYSSKFSMQQLEYLESLVSVNPTVKPLDLLNGGKNVQSVVLPTLDIEVYSVKDIPHLYVQNSTVLNRITVLRQKMKK